MTEDKVSSASEKPVSQSESAAGERKALDESKFRFIAFDVAVVPPRGLINHLKDKWWCVHPEKGVAFYVGHSRRQGHFTPQCNSNESITRRLLANYPWAEVRFIPSVFHAIDPHDYS